MTKVVITGNHLTPAEALVEQLPRNLKVYKLGDLDGPKFKRYDWWHSLWGLVKLPGLILKARARLRKIAAAVVVSFGGYSAVPVVWAAKILKIPILIHEQTFAAGLTSKITGRLADVIAISWESSRQNFPKLKTVLTGNPLRREILGVKRRPQPVVYITGGHQGAKVINDTVERILPQLLQQFTVYHQYGQLPRPAAREHYVTKAYFSAGELAKIYSQASLVIGRAGINTVTELAYLKIPAVLIPLPYTQRLEQDVNARYLEKLGLAVILPQDRLTPAALLSAVAQAKSLPGTSPGSEFPDVRVRAAAKKLCRLVVKLSRET